MGSAFDVKIRVHDLFDGLGIIGDVGIAVDGVLDDGAGYGEIDHVYGLMGTHHGVDQAAGKGVTAAYPVEDVEGEELAFKSVTLIPHIGFQAVLRAGVGIAHMAGDALQVGVAFHRQQALLAT